MTKLKPERTLCQISYNLLFSSFPSLIDKCDTKVTENERYHPY